MPSFTKEQCLAFARSAVIGADEGSGKAFLQLVECLAPDFVGARGVRSEKWSGKIPSQRYIEQLAAWFMEGREPFSVSEAGTKPDKAVDIILSTVFGVPVERIEALAKEHQHSMMAENAIGDLLERYLASVLEGMNWVWCSGSVLTAIDFLKFERTGVIAYQLKNRHNSENSSSSKVRSGTSIEKWFRYNSKDGTYHWDKFPDEAARKKLSEDGFRAFVKTTATEFKSRSSRR